MNYKFKLVIESLNKAIPTDVEAPHVSYEGECMGFILAGAAQEVGPTKPFSLNRAFGPGEECMITLLDCAVETINRFA